MADKIMKANGHIMQADWNQTDPLQMDYIHNKPEGVMTEQNVEDCVNSKIRKAMGNVVNLTETTISLTMVNNTEYCCLNPVESLVIEAFENDSEGVCSQWSIIFTPKENASIIVPETVKWAIVDPLFDGGKTYWLSFVAFGANYLGVWTVMY